MEAYLDVQSRFPFHSARNALLIEAKCPHAERIHDEKGWKDMGVTVLEEEKRLPIIILEPGKAYRREDGSVGQNFYAKEVYDISQTTARDQVQPQVRYDDRLLLKGLIASSPVPIRAVEELPQGRGAMFSAEQNAILVKKGMDAPDIFLLCFSGGCQRAACPKHGRLFQRDRWLQSLCCQLYALQAVWRGRQRV